MRTTVNLDARALAIVKSRASRERKTIGEVLSSLILDSVKATPYELEDGFPVLKVKEPRRVLTTEEVREMMDHEGI